MLETVGTNSELIDTSEARCLKEVVECGLARRIHGEGAQKKVSTNVAAEGAEAAHRRTPAACRSRCRRTLRRRVRRGRSCS
eukprot:920868-Pleurochrysis_carterae.AAC.1